SKLVSFNAAKPVPTDVPQLTVKIPRLVKHVVNKGNPQQALKDKCVIDSGCSRHMTGNISFLSDFKEINGGYVVFGGNPKGGKISGKGKIKIVKLDFDDVYFVKDLKFNLFNVSQMCDKKNNVLFTDTECVVLSSNYKLPDENHVLFRVSRDNNMYNVDLKNVVHSGDLTCLFAKAILDEKESNIEPLVSPNLSVQSATHYKGKQPNDNAGIKENLVASKVGKDTVSAQQYRMRMMFMFLPMKLTRLYIRNMMKSLKEMIKERVIAPVNAVEPNLPNNINNFNTASPSVNVVCPNIRIARKSSFMDPSKYLDDPDMPELEDIVYLDDEEDVSAQTDLSNLESNRPVSPIPTTRVHKDHPVNQIIGDLNLAPQTRSMNRMVKEQGELHQINDEDFYTYTVACFLSKKPKRVHQALKDPSWIEAMQDELL
nr:ribonuclease H-like domain-containing protein [Tanacetum cinerariifolium]